MGYFLGQLLKFSGDFLFFRRVEGSWHVRGVGVLLSVLGFVLSATVLAQKEEVKSFPQRPIRFLAPFTPGAGTDVTARMLAQKLTDTWGQQAVVDNRTGAAGAIAVELTARATPDGYTVCLISASQSVNSATNSQLPFDLGRDLQGITQASSLFYTVYINPAVPAKNAKELIAYSKVNPTKLLFGSSGTGSLQHFAGEMLNHLAGARLTHIPYKGTSAVITATLSNVVQVGFGTLFGVKAHMLAGRLRVVAITASKRSAAVPEIPTLVESGIPGYEIDQWYGVITGAKVPKAIVYKLSEAMRQGLKQPEVIQRLAADGSVTVGSTPEAFSAYIKAEMRKWQSLVKAAHIDLQGH